MYVCICRSVTDKQIRQAVADGAESFAQLQARTGCSTCCGRCKPEARRLFRDSLAERRARESVLPILAIA